jgi:hypothetical protein
MDIYKEIEDRAINAESLDQSVEVLSDLLCGGFSVWTDGRLYRIKQLVARVKGLSIYIYSDEHVPPHFHIKSADV